MIVLGIESSCDETGIALYDGQRGLLAEALHSQIETHAVYGGVVPELASRDHVRHLVPLVKQVLQQAGIDRADAVAYTAGPGLAGALLTGAAFGRSLAWGWQVPAVAVHHMEAHLLAPLLEAQRPDFPFIALLVSGGHTLLVQVNAIGDYQLLGESLDDAVGEAFDKTAKMMGLGYPGGPAIAAYAERIQHSRFNFPRPMTDRPGLDFSFSGLKTYALTCYQQQKIGLNEQELEQLKAEIAHAFQEAVVDTLLIKCRRALQQSGLKQLVLAGGVAANQRLRQRMQALMMEMNGQVFYPRLSLCTDNGAMVAYAGYQRLRLGERTGLDFSIQPRWSLMDLNNSRLFKGR